MTIKISKQFFSQVDIILIASQALGPADGSHYIINYFGAGLKFKLIDTGRARVKSNHSFCAICYHLEREKSLTPISTNCNESEWSDRC